MPSTSSKCVAAVFITICLPTTALAQSLSPELKAKVDSKITQYKSWSIDPSIVGAVKEHNANPPAPELGGGAGPLVFASLRFPAADLLLE